MRKNELKNSEMKEFYVREDTNNARATNIHHKKCGFYKKHLKSISHSSIWHGPLSKQQAEELAIEISKKYATGWEYARCCIKS